VVQYRVYLRVPPRINLVQAFSDGIHLLAGEKVRQGGSIQLTPGHSETAGSCFRQTEKIVRDRHCSFHGSSITRVIPVGLTCPPRALGNRPLQNSVAVI
jgi:hypothetical protein